MSRATAFLMIDGTLNRVTIGYGHCVTDLVQKGELFVKGEDSVKSEDGKMLRKIWTMWVDPKLFRCINVEMADFLKQNGLELDESKVTAWGYRPEEKMKAYIGSTLCEKGLYATVAESAYAWDLKSQVPRDVGVQNPPVVPKDKEDEDD